MSIEQAMKNTLLLPIVLLLLTASCNKSDDDTNNTNTGSTWKVGSTTYKVNNFTTASETYSAYDTAGNGISFSFSTFPPPAGTYAVIGNTASLGAGQVKAAVFTFG